ncbi:MAG: GNAT family N-acetyltransferase [Actinomycetota bacterium]|nr:GNAT family N-acetyltransferase [Actinomycetota bacterium]
MTESARLARAADVPVMRSIAATVEATLEGARGAVVFLGREAADEAWRIGVAVDEGRAVVGTYDDAPFGYAVFTTEELNDQTLLGRIESLAVLPDARGAGIGEAMMNLVIAILRDAGCASIDAHALPGDRETKNFFESFGLKARLLVVNLALDSGDD